MNYRDYLQQVIYKIINPLIHGMIKIGITPNFITTTGFILNVVPVSMADKTIWLLSDGREALSCLPDCSI